MSPIEKRIQEFESRPAGFDAAKQAERAAMIQHFSAINRFEGIMPSATDERLFALLSSGKITKKEYLDLCIADARNMA